MRIILIRTCGACPEQYDAWYNDTRIGYLRLRHGHFTAEYTDAKGRSLEVYSDFTESDGIFSSEERSHYLAIAARALAERHYMESFPGVTYEVL